MSPSRCPRQRELEAEGLEAESCSTEALRIHQETCADCRTERAWRQRERAWFAQRARRTPQRPALEWEALAARLDAAQEAAWTPMEPTRASLRPHRRRVALPALAACLVALLPMLFNAPPPSEELAAGVTVPACFLPDDDGIPRLESAVGACLIASTTIAQSG